MKKEEREGGRTVEMIEASKGGWNRRRKERKRGNRGGRGKRGKEMK